MKKFVEDALRTDSDQFHPISPRILHGAIGLVTESAEIMDAIKKSMFYGRELDLVNLKEEIGDCMWYLALLMDALDTDFETEGKRVIEKLKIRYPEKFTSDHANTRDLEKERLLLESI